MGRVRVLSERRRRWDGRMGRLARVSGMAVHVGEVRRWRQVTEDG